MEMLMAGCANSKELPMSNPLHTWKLQPLATTISQITKCPAIPSHYSGCFPQTQTDLSPLTYHLAATATAESQQFKRKISGEPGNWVSSRWNPTPEQLQCLEELYCSGTRTPTAKQIQQIAAKLRRFGKIEGKNVFYWFQNHKSRERQKQHRKMNLGLRNPGSVRKQPGISRANADHRQANNWASISNSCTSSEESVSLQRAVCNADKRINFEERQRELLQRGSRTLTAKNARWQKMEMPPATTCTTAPETLLEASGQMLVEDQSYITLVTTEHENVFNLELVEDETRRRESQTLQLFPVCSQVLQTPNVVQDDAESPVPTRATDFIPVQFYEFFPLNM